MAVKQVSQDLKQPRATIMQLLRSALAGSESGVGVPKIIEILGKEKVLRRVEKCKEWSQNSA
jgi:glutamyl/glutaminyl-tRNA synthetase